MLKESDVDQHTHQHVDKSLDKHRDGGGLRENDVIYTKLKQDKVRKLLAAKKHCKLVLKTDQPAAYAIA